FLFPRQDRAVVGRGDRALPACARRPYVRSYECGVERQSTLCPLRFFGPDRAVVGRGDGALLARARRPYELGQECCMERRSTARILRRHGRWHTDMESVGICYQGASIES